MALAFLLVACGGESETYRYRMTVYVDTPAGQRSGSSVIEVVSTPAAPMGSSQEDVRGEAVAVDLPGGTLFALLSDRTHESAAAYYVGRAYAAVLPYGSDSRTHLDILRRQTEPAALPRDELPPLIRFRNPADSRTVEALDPSNLAAGFGPGVRLNRVEVQMTNDPVTSTIESRLPNFGAGSGYDAWSATLRFNDPRNLAAQDFRIGF